MNGRRVHHAQAAVDVERVERRIGAEKRWRGHDLEGVAGADVLARPLDRRPRRPRAVRLLVTGPSTGSSVGLGRPRHRARQAGAQLGDGRDGAPVGGLGVVVARAGRAPRSSATRRRWSNTTTGPVMRAIRSGMPRSSGGSVRQALDRAHQVVAEEAHRAAPEGERLGGGAMPTRSTASSTAPNGSEASSRRVSPSAPVCDQLAAGAADHRLRAARRSSSSAPGARARPTPAGTPGRRRAA